jgi:hypothetical protein
MLAPVEPLVTGLAQISVVVRDVHATMKRYVEVAGIGPWAVYEFGPPEVTNIRLRGQPATFNALIAIAWTGESMWELIQPVDGSSIYQEFLDQRGDGMHHVLVRHAGHDMDETIKAFGKHGCEVAMSFERGGTRFAYIDATRHMKMILEVLQRPAAAGQQTAGPASKPSYWYPYDPPQPWGAREDGEQRLPKEPTHESL